ncbi:hypothetical protein LTR10_023962 [Elasticomyces elasticus]|uniref:G domain-containing protein n=1 Tax=Exophiala sideris TaxID=1016849 RepID=A0ABR0J0X4_9EURO|nr:hypothetical protein LTR10_023962 [Elasticomyces elasticus]KAK5023810.1 hypothetical protein LTS07_008935 [Exophiala sideris]KAK5030171.1 hypothetical protein LTR13_008484 [Exophiala sideris]KAK5053666.1 hypothetical protein LTR69_009311 [Exophiala sideris]KAK5179291.1 hypothetical protein LTR44_008129 [Eurotiomycetes sp. CCFEE 6388]
MATSTFLPGRDDVIIAVMGMTGSGKSSFINKFRTNRPVRIGRELESCTNEVDIYKCRDDEFGTFWLIDTPGFNDTYRSDTEVLGEIANWLNRAYLEEIQLTGILYMHAIRETRMGKKALDSVRSFNKLCGSDALRKVVLVSTFWDMVDPDVGDHRERELKERSDCWADMLKHHSKVFRHYNHLSTAKAVIRHLLNIRTTEDQGTYLSIQHEMVDQRQTLAQTGAGKLLADALERQRIDFEQELARLQAELRAAIEQQNQEQRRLYEELRRDAEERQRRWKADRDRIEADYEDLMRLTRERDALEAVEEKRKEEEKEAEVRKLKKTLQELRDKKANVEHERKKHDQAQRESELLRWRQQQRRQLQYRQGPQIGCRIL